MISRGDWPAVPGLSKMSMSNIIGELMGLGIVREIEATRCPRALWAADPATRPYRYFPLRHWRVRPPAITSRSPPATCAPTSCVGKKRPYPASMDQETLIRLTLEAIRQVRRTWTGRCWAWESPLLAQ